MQLWKFWTESQVDQEVDAAAKRCWRSIQAIRTACYEWANNEDYSYDIFRRSIWHQQQVVVNALSELRRIGSKKSTLLAEHLDDSYERLAAIALDNIAYAIATGVLWKGHPNKLPTAVVEATESTMEFYLPQDPERQLEGRFHELLSPK